MKLYKSSLLMSTGTLKSLAKQLSMERSLKILPSPQRLNRSLVAALLTSSMLTQCWFPKPASAQTTAYCRFTPEAISEKESLLQVALKGNQDTEKRYKTLLKQHAEYLRQCRNQTWPNNQATWLRLYPCDSRPGAMDKLLDRIVNLGYNQVYVEVFGDSQVLLPAADNPTPWPSVVRTPGNEKVDLLAQIVQKGRERGVKVYAWMFTMNFGYTYALRPDKDSVLARNGKGQKAVLSFSDGMQVFIDPYNVQAKRDYYQLVQAFVKRRPDGLLFDYIRYPRGQGTDSVVTKVQDLWIYGNSARQALYGRALNTKGRLLIERFMNNGVVTAGDIQTVDQLYPQEGSPLWQGRNPPPNEMLATPAQRQPLLQWELWQLSVAHAVQGILDFVNLARQPAQKQGIKTGTVFFPEANMGVGQVGYDSRLQPWERFSNAIEWHPMVYATCGSSSCIEDQVKRVLKRAPAGTKVEPVLAGMWGKSINNRPSLEVQMQGIRQATPQINSVSHFAFSWQDPEFDRQRKTCRL
jgi:hypothetical protein